MALHMSLDHDGRVYFMITCDTCQQPLLNFDDACYSYPALRVEAVFAGWEAGDRPEQPHQCPACLRRAANPRDLDHLFGSGPE